MAIVLQNRILAVFVLTDVRLAVKIPNYTAPHRPFDCVMHQTTIGRAVMLAGNAPCTDSNDALDWFKECCQMKEVTSAVMRVETLMGGKTQFIRSYTECQARGGS